MSDLKQKVDEALDNLEQKRKEYAYKVQELEDICEEFEMQARNLFEERDSLLLLLRQVKHNALEKDLDKVLELLEGIDE